MKRWSGTVSSVSLLVGNNESATDTGTEYWAPRTFLVMKRPLRKKNPNDVEKLTKASRAVRRRDRGVPMKRCFIEARAFVPRALIRQLEVRAA